MEARIIDGKLVSKNLKVKLSQEISDFVTKGHRPPALAVVLVGDDPASHVYVSHKEKGCQEVGIHSETFRLPSTTSQETLESLLNRLSSDASWDGILLQLPLPKHLASDRALDCIHVDKDVDGLSPLNQGRLMCGKPGLFSCTPLGCMELIRSTGVEIEGKNAVVIGRSILVGSPLATMLNHANATVTVIHSKTKDPAEIAARADILVAAAGRLHLVDETWVKPGAVVIDVGMHRLLDGKLTGDVDFEIVKRKAGFITPVPGGVGPMTIVMLLRNCFDAYRRSL